MTNDCTVLFEVPADATGVAKAIYEAYGIIDGIDTEMHPAEYLASRAGQIVEVGFVDDQDPAGTLITVAAALEKAGSRYVGVSKSYTEPSRGERIQAQFHYNAEGDARGRRQAFFPWHEGEPQLDPRSLEIAGVPADELAGIEMHLLHSATNVSP